MAQATLEERVAVLEKAVAQLLAQRTAAGTKKDWRSTVGMFHNDPAMKEIDEEGRKIRETDRRQANQ